MHATRALDYLVLNASKRINYRVQKDISLQEWYESFKPQPLQGEDMGYQEVNNILGINYHRLRRLRSKGYFAEVHTNGSGKRIKVSEINKVLECEAYLIPVPAFKDIIEEQVWNISWRTFGELFKKYYEHGIDQFAPYVSIGNAAKIIYEARRRKTIIEDWPTYGDLNRESGLNLNPARRNQYFREMIKNS